MAARTAELAAHNLCLAQTQFDLDVLREVPKDSPQYIDALRSPIPNHLPVRWLAAEQPQPQPPPPRADAPAPSAPQPQDSTRDSPGKALLPEDAPLRRGFFALHALFSPEHAFDPTAGASDDDYSDMPGLGPVIVQTPPPSSPQPQEQEQEQPQQTSPSLVRFDDLLSSDAVPPPPAAPPATAVDVLTACTDDDADLDNPFAVPSTDYPDAPPCTTDAAASTSFVDPFAF